ncbi:hypothetical protein A3Q56_02475 [Intoshia linei]|uniref:histone acetyltransferase n=1 Tax=Intoshia linei TaxID=1819745 RepID=A0A177B646_9BILA|nr:hypothetical protein A3Q56_02475 [Intoshia linei]
MSDSYLTASAESISKKRSIGTKDSLISSPDITISKKQRIIQSEDINSNQYLDKTEISISETRSNKSVEYMQSTNSNNDIKDGPQNFVASTQIFSPNCENVQIKMDQPISDSIANSGDTSDYAYFEKYATKSVEAKCLIEHKPVTMENEFNQNVKDKNCETLPQPMSQVERHHHLSQLLSADMSKNVYSNHNYQKRNETPNCNTPELKLNMLTSPLTARLNLPTSNFENLNNKGSSFKRVSSSYGDLNDIHRNSPNSVRVMYDENYIVNHSYSNNQNNQKYRPVSMNYRHPKSMEIYKNKIPYPNEIYKGQNMQTRMIKNPNFNPNINRMPQNMYRKRIPEYPQSNFNEPMRYHFSYAQRKMGPSEIEENMNEQGQIKYSNSNEQSRMFFDNGAHNQINDVNNFFSPHDKNAVVSSVENPKNPELSVQRTLTSEANLLCSDNKIQAMNQYRQEYQKRLVLLLHAHKCMRRDEANREAVDCKLPHCFSMKRILKHVSTCRAGRDCKVPHCYSSRQIISHWKNCTSTSCLHCMPLKTACDKKKQDANSTINLQIEKDFEKQKMIQETNSASTCQTMATPLTSDIISATNENVHSDGSSPSKIQGRCVGVYDENRVYYRLLQPKLSHPWHTSMPPRLRHYFVDKLISTVVPKPSPVLFKQRKSMDTLFIFAQVVEVEMYEKADSQENYYHMLAEKIYNISKELEKRRRCIDKSKSDDSQIESVEETKHEIEYNKPEDVKENIVKIEPKIKIENNSKIDVKPQDMDVDNDVKKLRKPKIFNVDEMRVSFLRILESIYKQEDSEAFRYPVSSEVVPDYYKIIKHPMDLSTIKTRLDQGSYTDPWMFIQDVWQMFENAWIYNKKSSHIHKKSTKLSELFLPDANLIMRSMGLCCGRYYVYYAKALGCTGKSGCVIPRNGMYFTYDNRIHYCEKCYNDISLSYITYEDESTSVNALIKSNIQKIEKTEFVRKKNDNVEPEVMVTCSVCDRKLHQNCVLYSELITSELFVCDFCVKEQSLTKLETKVSFKRLQSTKMGTYLENRLNSFLKKKDEYVGEIIVRVVAITDRYVEVKPRMRERFCNQKGKMSERYPYKCKVIFVAQVIDGTEVYLFGMHVQEYGSECPAPNTGIAYISYLDSINFFRPCEFRTHFYHEILIGYMDYVKSIGFIQVRFWACPPCEGDDYIFHCHPEAQKVPKPKRLVEWYKKMLDKATIERVVIEYTDIMKEAIDSKFTSATNFPYFDGDYWPNVMEDSIKELVDEEAKILAESKKENTDDCEDSSDFVVDSNSKNKSKSKSKIKPKKSGKKSYKKKKPKKMVGHGDELLNKLINIMEKHKDVFFVIYLVDKESFKRNSKEFKSVKIIDPDPLINCDLMDGRDPFLSMCRERHLEFSSLRRAKFSSIITNYELMVQGSFYNCNRCKTNIETRYHCTTCDDFDLCIICYRIVGHNHYMTKKGIYIDFDSKSQKRSDSKLTAAVKANNKEQTLKKVLESLNHAARCRDANCRTTGCGRLKHSIQHFNLCGAVGSNSDCQSCKRFVYLCWYHAKYCKDVRCVVPLCTRLQVKYQDKRNAQRAQADHLAQRRAAEMHRAMQLPTNVNSTHEPNTPLQNEHKNEKIEPPSKSPFNGSEKSQETQQLSQSKLNPNSRFWSQQSSHQNPVNSDYPVNNFPQPSSVRQPNSQFANKGYYGRMPSPNTIEPRSEVSLNITDKVSPAKVNQLLQILQQYTGDSRKQVLASFLKSHPEIVNVYLHNAAVGLTMADNNTIYICNAISTLNMNTIRTSQMRNPNSLVHHRLMYDLNQPSENARGLRMPITERPINNEFDLVQHDIKNKPGQSTRYGLYHKDVCQPMHTYPMENNMHHPGYRESENIYDRNYRRNPISTDNARLGAPKIYHDQMQLQKYPPSRLRMDNTNQQNQQFHPDSQAFATNSNNFNPLLISSDHAPSNLNTPKFSENEEIKSGSNLQDKLSRRIDRCVMCANQKMYMKTSYNRHYPECIDCNIRMAERPRSSGYFIPKYLYKKPVGVSTYVTHYNNNIGMDIAEYKQPARPHTANTDRYNNPHPLEPFMNWMVPRKLCFNKKIYPEKIETEYTLPSKRRKIPYNRYIKNLVSTYQDSFIDITTKPNKYYKLIDMQEKDVEKSLDNSSKNGRNTNSAYSNYIKTNGTIGRYEAAKLQRKFTPAAGIVPKNACAPKDILSLLRIRSTYDTDYNYNKI